MVQGRVVSVTPRELVVRTGGAETMRVDVTKLSPWTRDSVRAGDQVKLFGVPQRDRRLVANGFIQEAPAAPAAAPATR
jgi:allophanate hydrolase subunit 2